MIKTTITFSAHTIHLLHLFVRSFFIALIILLAALFFWLIHGIEIERLYLGSYKVEGLYIKLDKKLTLRAEEITLPRKKAAPSFSRVDKTFDEIKYLLTFFDMIVLEKINFQNNHLTFLYTGNILYISSDAYEIAGTIEREKDKLVAEVSMLHLKKEQVDISGKLTYDLKENRLETGGSFKAYGIEGHFRAVQIGDEIIYALNTKRFEDLHPLIERFKKLHPVIRAWILDRVRARSYKVAYLKGRLLITGESIKPDLGALKAKVDFDDVTIRYHDNAPPSHAKALSLRLKTGNLYFDLEQPEYDGRDLNGTTVVIKHILGTQPPVLILDLHAVTPIDGKVAQILRAYGLHIPVTHTGKKNRVTVTLKIPLGKTKKHLKAFVKVLLDKGDATIDGFSSHVEGGTVLYKEGRITLEAIKLKEKRYEAILKGVINPKRKWADLLVDLKYLALGDPRSPLLRLKQLHIPVKLSYKKGLQITIPTLGTEIKRNGKELKITFSDISKIVPFMSKNILDIDGGTMEIESRDMQHYHFQGILHKNSCFFYDDKGICYTRIPIEGTFESRGRSFDLYAFGKRLHIDSAKERIWIDNLNIDLKRFFDERKQHKAGNTDKHIVPKHFVIIGKKSHLRYGSYRLVTDSYDIEIFPNGDIKAIGSVDGEIVKFERKGSHFSIKALRVTDTLLHPLINFSGLKGGRYSITSEGDPDKLMKGRIIIEGGVLSDFKAYSNTLAFVNTLPALATLNSPGFSNKGFKIKEGVIEYSMTPEKITFDSVYLKGNSATVLGKGTVDLKSKKLDIKLVILTVRELGKVVGKIPVLGYILMGKDHSMTVGLRVKGTLDDPKVSTSVAKDILTLPLQILKRTITAPAELGKHRQSAPDIPDFNHQEKEIKKTKNKETHEQLY